MPRSFARYLAWQAPGWLILGAALFWLWQTLGLATWLAITALALYVAKDLALYPVMRTTFRAPTPTRPIGRRAEAVERLAPTGYVRIDGELWKARAVGGHVTAGHHVIVRAADGFTLIVEADSATGSL